MIAVFGILIYLAFPICGLLGWYFHDKFKYEERKLMIEKGMHPDVSSGSSDRRNFIWVKLGIVVLGLGIGFLIVALLVNLRLTGHSDAIYPAVFCLCGGGSLVIAHIIDSRKK